MCNAAAREAEARESLSTQDFYWGWSRRHPLPAQIKTPDSKQERRGFREQFRPREPLGSSGNGGNTPEIQVPRGQGKGQPHEQAFQWITVRPARLTPSARETEVGLTPSRGLTAPARKARSPGPIKARHSQHQRAHLWSPRPSQVTGMLCKVKRVGCSGPGKT